MSATDRIASSGQTTPPPPLCVCSTHTRRARGAWFGGLNGWGTSRAASTSAAEKIPPWLARQIVTPERAAAPPPSLIAMWAPASMIAMSPGSVWARSATWLDMVPEGT